MFDATLDSVEIRLGETETAVTSAIRELAEISGLTWQTMAGKEFTERSGELVERLSELLRMIGSAKIQLVTATNELAELEERIIQQQLVG